MITLPIDSSREDVMETAPRLWDLRPTPVVAVRAEVRDAGDAEHFVVCLECGRGYDKRNLSHALYHAEPAHDPFFVETVSRRT